MAVHGAGTRARRCAGSRPCGAWAGPVNVIIFGATGMIGRAVLRECLRDDSVESVLTIGRTPLGLAHRKLRDVLQPDPPTSARRTSAW